MRTETKGQTASMRFTLVANVRAGLKYDKDADLWVGYAPALKLYSQAKTKARARRAIAGAVNLFLKVAYTKGVLGRVLQDAGFVPVPDGGSAPARARADLVRIVEEKILKREKFEDRFTVPAKLQLARAA